MDFPRRGLSRWIPFLATQVKYDRSVWDARRVSDGAGPAFALQETSGRSGSTAGDGHGGRPKNGLSAQVGPSAGGHPRFLLSPWARVGRDIPSRTKQRTGAPSPLQQPCRRPPLIFNGPKSLVKVHPLPADAGYPYGSRMARMGRRGHPRTPSSVLLPGVLKGRKASPPSIHSRRKSLSPPGTEWPVWEHGLPRTPSSVLLPGVPDRRDLRTFKDLPGETGPGSSGRWR